jgi:hypothetical protein
MGGGSGLHHGGEIPHGGRNERLGGKNGPLGVSGSFGSNIPLGGRLIGKGKSPRRGSGLIGRLGMIPPWNPKYSVLVIPTPNATPTQKSCLTQITLLKLAWMFMFKFFKKTFWLIILVLKLLQHVRRTWVMITKNCWSLLQNRKIQQVSN